ncbi:SbcC/MukB-like Walker B domain-containing protein, partial [Caldovatus aquaticus]
EALRRDREARTAAAAAAEAAARAAAEAAARAATETDRRAAQEAAFARLCAEAGFAGIAAFEAARLPPGEADALEERIAGFDQALATARAAEAEARRAAEGVAPPDLAALERAAEEAAAEQRAATAAAAALRQRLSDADRLLAAIAEAGRDLAAAREALELRQELAALVAGRNPQNLSLEGFVLRSLLDEALSAANRRLRAMLRGRYQLRRVEDPVRRGVGLDIEVLDEWNGGVRPPGTLSGGEGFCAALAMALGLADTVQAHAGARRIDALFVDEGFGTLDEEALDTAMEVLAGLGGGDRLVGVISHVAELRARIPARLEVTPGRRGSTATFRIG